MPKPHLRPPHQNRSRRTLDRILDSAARLLESRSFEELTVLDVVSEAGCSVGAFYGRLRDKEGLLHALDERYFAELDAALHGFVTSQSVEVGTLAEVLEELASMLMRFHTRQRGLLRALILHARVHRSPAFESREESLWKQVPLLAERLLRHRGEVDHGDPERAIVFALLQMLYALREMTLWPHIAGRAPFRDADLAGELARAAYAYLTMGPLQHPTQGRR